MSLIDYSEHVTEPDGWADLKPIGIAIHHTVTRMDADASEKEERLHLEAIDNYHVSLDYGGLGYHFVVFPSGRGYRTGNPRRARAHVAKRNHELQGIALVGDFTSESPTTLALQTVGEILRELNPEHHLAVRGHRDWAVPGWGTECPASLTAIDWGRVQDGLVPPAWFPSMQQVAHSLHFAYTGYYLGKQDALVGSDREVLRFLAHWYDGQDLPF